MAVERKDPAAILVLLRHGANAKAVDDEKKTPLHRATMSGDVAIVEALLYGGVDIVVTAKDQDGYTALHLAANGGHEKLVTLLLNNGADISAVGNDGDTPMHCVARGDSADPGPTIDTLLRNGSCINVISPTGRTPLHFAAHRGNLQATQALLGRGADISMVDSAGKTAWILPPNFTARKGVLGIQRFTLLPRTVIQRWLGYFWIGVQRLRLPVVTDTRLYTLHLGAARNVCCRCCWIEVQISRQQRLGKVQRRST